MLQGSELVVACTGPIVGPVQASKAFFACMGPGNGPVRTMMPPNVLNGDVLDNLLNHCSTLTVVNKGTVVARAEFAFQRARAGGNGRARRDDGVCLSAS